MTTEFNHFVIASPFLNCHLLESNIACSILIEHENEEWHEDIQCHVRLHGSHCLSPTFTIQMAHDGRMQLNSVLEDVGEVKKIVFDD